MKKESNLKIYFFAILGFFIFMCCAFGIDYLNNIYLNTGDLKYSIYTTLGSSFIISLLYSSIGIVPLILFKEGAKEHGDKSFLRKVYFVFFIIFLIIFLLVLSNDVAIKDYKTPTSKGSIDFILNQFKDIENGERITIVSNDISIVEKSKHFRGSKGSSSSTHYYRYLKIGDEYLIPIEDKQSFFIDFLIEEDTLSKKPQSYLEYIETPLSDYEIIMHKESGRIIFINGFSMFFDDLDLKKEEFKDRKRKENFTSNLKITIDDKKTSFMVDFSELTPFLSNLQNNNDLILSMVDYEGNIIFGPSVKENYKEINIVEERNMYIVFLSNGFSEMYSNFAIICVNDGKIIDSYISSYLGTSENIEKAVNDFKEIYNFYWFLSKKMIYKI